jgi:hypothetical protein
METKSRHIFTNSIKLWSILLIILAIMLGYVYIKKCAGVFYFCTHGILVESYEKKEQVSYERIHPDRLSPNGTYRVEIAQVDGLGDELRVYEIDTGTMVAFLAYPRSHSFRDPIWIDDTHLYTERSCGTACSALVLLDVSTDTASEALMMHAPVRKWDPPVGYFRDWLGREHWFDVVMTDIDIVQDQERPMLVFTMFDFETDSKVGTKSYHFNEITE